MAKDVTAEVEWFGVEVTDLLHDSAVEGLTLAVEHLLTESRKEVPLDEGTLERSGVATVDEDKLQGAVSFDTPYAVRQHENMTARHAGGRKAKYLEDPLNAHKATMLELIATPMRRALQEGS